MSDKILEVKNLNVEYYLRGKSIPAVRGVDLALGRGECVGVAGESGCGKSTLASAILDIIDSKEGRITGGEINFYSERGTGVNLIKASAQEKRKIRGKLISFIFQDPYNSLNPVIKIGRQLREAYLVHNPDAEDSDERVKEVLEEVHLPASRIMNSYPHQLSGGMLQRVCIACALINSPEILIADEPTSNLDVTIQKKIVDNLKELSEKHNLSLIFITHNLNLVSGLADTLYILYAGEVVEYGPSSRIFRNPLHPYTAGLLNALPSLSKRERKIQAIPGTVPHPSRLPDGCGFAPRCGTSGEVCSNEKIKMKEAEPGHFIRCL